MLPQTRTTGSELLGKPSARKMAGLTNIAIARSPCRAPQPRKMPSWTPPLKMAPKVNENVQKVHVLDIFHFPKSGLVGHFNRLLGPSFGGCPRWHFSDFKMHFWGFGVPGLCRGTGLRQDMQMTGFIVTGFRCPLLQGLGCCEGSGKKGSSLKKGEAFSLTVGAFLLSAELLCFLQQCAN